MVLVPSNLNVPPTSSNQSSVNLNRLFSVGQVLSAKIQPISNEQVKITIGNQSLVAATKHPITESGSVLVKVKQLSPDIQLSLVSSEKANNKQTSNQLTLQTAYRQFIPTQAPLSNSFQQISLLQSLPPSLQAPINQLLNLLNKTETQNLTGKELKERLANSGLFLESKLKANAPSQSIKQDLKAQLLQLQQLTDKAQLSQNSSALSKLSIALNQAISRITLQQIQLYENPMLSMLDVLNEKDNRVTEDYIEIHQRHQEGKKSWEVFVDLNLPNGLFSSKLVLDATEQLSCYIWCDNSDLFNKLKERLPELENLLKSQDYSNLTLQMSVNKPSKPKQSIKVALIDIKI